MAYEIENTTKSKCIVRVVGSTTGLTLNLADFAANTVTEQNPISAVTETVSAITISRAFWSSNSVTSFWRVSRGGSNTILELAGTGSWNLIENGIAVANSATQNVNIDLIGTTNGTLILEVSKRASYSPSI